MIQRHPCICILVFHLTMLFYDFNFSLFHCRHDDKDTQVKKLMIFKNILNKKELSLNLIIINITTHFRPNFLCTENILFVRNCMLFFESNNHPQYWNKMATIFSILQFSEIFTKWWLHKTNLFYEFKYFE